MSLLPIYLNEVSLPSQGLERRDLIKCVIRMIAALRAVSNIADELVFGAKESIANVGLCEEFQTLASLTAEIDRDWWRVFKSIESRSPLSEVPHSVRPDADEEVEISGAVSDGALWAHRNATLVLSFPWKELYARSELPGLFRKLETSGLSESQITLRQISTVASVAEWQELIENYGVEEAASSLVFEDQTVALRMYLNDHEPPHVHVFLLNEPRKCRAKIRFDKAEFLKNTLSAGTSSHVLGLVQRHKAELESGWERCRAGRLPIRLDG